MERRQERNRIRDRVKMLRRHIEVDAAAIQRFKHQTTNVEYNSVQVKKKRARNEEREEEIEELEEREKQVNSGELDEELRNATLSSHAEVGRRSAETRQKKDKEREVKKEKSVRSIAYYQSGRQSDRNARWAKKNADRAYKHFVRACNSVPDYMLRKLSNMPNNKGYIWKGVCCYGDLPYRKGQPTVLFERQRNGILAIHEWTDREYKLWHKKGKARKYLVEQKRRRKVQQGGPSLADYMK